MSAGVMWRVRLDDGSEYGPVEEGKLLSWAREGRITPSSQISSDGTTWILASRKPELGMDWLVETSPGEYFGPFHHDVVQGLLDSGKITSETRTFRLSDKSESALKSEIGKLQADYERVKSEKEDAAKRVQSLSAERDKSRAETAEATRRAEALASELSQNRTDAKTREEALAAASKREVALSAELGQLKTALRRIELELTTSRENTTAERTRADRITAELKASEEKRSREAAELERVSAGKAAETARANNLAAELSRLSATLDYEKSQGEQLRSSLAAASKRETALAEKAKDSGTALEQLKSVFEGTQAKLKQAETRGVELASSLKASEGRGEAVAAELAESKSALEGVRSELAALKDELAAAKSHGSELSAALEAGGKREAALTAEGEALQSELAAVRSELEETKEAVEKSWGEQEKTKAQLEKAEARGMELKASFKALEEKRNVLAAEVKSEQDRGRKLGELLSASACREAALAEEARSFKNAMDQASARVRKLSEELESARTEVVKERKTCGELRVALEKVEKAGKKKTGLGNLFQGKSLHDLSLLELAAQRELTRRKRGGGLSGHDRPNVDVIDV